MSALTQNDAGNKDSWKSSLNIFQRRVALQEGTESANGMREDGGAPEERR